MLKKHSYYITIFILGIIIFIACIFRFYNLGNYPVGFQIDEASLGYNGYSLLQTGKSDEGHSFPLYIDIFGDQRPSGYHFLTIVPIIFFGLSEFSTRLPGAVFGILSIVPFFLLSQFLTKDKKIALLAAFFLAIAPWHTVLSRASAETVVALFFILFGFYFLLKSISVYSKKYLVLSLIFLTISYFFYHTSRVFVPLMVIGTVILFHKDLLIKKQRAFAVVFGIGIGILFFISFALVFLITGGSGRFSQVNVFSHPETTLVLSEQYREDGISGIGAVPARFFHNKIVNFGANYLSNYLGYFSGDFLFISGGLPIWYDVDRMGLLYFFELPFLLIGIFFLLKKPTKLSLFPIVWMILSPVVAALTVDDIPNFQRAIVLLPMLNFISAYGCMVVLYKLKNNWRIVGKIILGVIIFYCVIYFLHQYFIHGHAHRTWYRNNGFSEMMQQVNKKYEEVDKVIMTKTGGGYPLVLFYSQYSPKKYIEEGSPKDSDYKGFGKFVFVPQECPSLQSGVNIGLNEKVVFVDRGTCEINKGLLERVDILREDGSMGFRVYVRPPIKMDRPL